MSRSWLTLEIFCIISRSFASPSNDQDDALLRISSNDQVSLLFSFVKNEMKSLIEELEGEFN